MCQNAQKTVAAVLEGAEPYLKSILTLEGVANTPQAAAALTAYDQAVTDLGTWVPGTPPEETIEVLQDLQQAITVLPIPANYQFLANTVLAIVVTAIGIVDGNSPASTAAALLEGVTEEQVQQDHERATMVTYAARAQALVPFYKIKTRATWLPERQPAAQVKACWSKAVEITGAPESFKA